MNMFKIKINFLTYILIFLLLYSGYKNILIIVFIVFFFHEVGHIFFCIFFHVKITSLEIYPFGGFLKINNCINYSVVKSLFIASGGLLFQVILYVINYYFIKNKLLTYYNEIIFITNIIPIVPFDGNRIIQIFLSNYMSYYFSLVISYFVSVLTTLLVILYFYESHSFNYFYLIFSITYLFKEISNLKVLFNSFLLERYLYDFSFKKRKNHKYFSFNKMHINKYNYFYVNGWKNEQYFLRKRFDKSSEFC